VDAKLLVQVSEDDADAVRLDALAGYLRSELIQLDVDEISAVAAAEPPPGARTSAAEVAGGLLVSLGKSAASLPAVVSAVVDWLRRGLGPDRRVRLELEGDVLEISRASTGDQQRLIDLFVRRHSAGADS